MSEPDYLGIDLGKDDSRAAVQFIDVCCLACGKPMHYQQVTFDGGDWVCVDHGRRDHQWVLL
jgi:hypothetical protein